MSTLEQRLDGGGIIVLDGAMGTELQRRGVPMDDAAWSAAALLTHPDTVREVHEDYIRAGADLIITNTFSTARHVLEPAGMGERFRELNNRAVELAEEARAAADRPVFIAGSISTFTARYDYSYEPPAEKARANYREQAEVLAGAGVDVIALEMMRDLEQTTYAIEAAVATGLQVWIGFSCKAADDDGTVALWDGRHTLGEALERITTLEASLVSIMHTRTEDTPAALREVTGRWSGPVGAYPHSGEFIMPNWQFIDMISPEGFAAEAQGWLSMGARVIGGCCGIGPEHIRLLKERLSPGAPPIV